MSLLDDAVNFVNNIRHKSLTHTVTYKRGTSSKTLEATVGKTHFRIEGNFGIKEHYESRDYLIRTAELILDGHLTLPERGDQIEEIRDGFKYSYEVNVPGNEAHFRYSDPFQKVLRLHTKEIDREEI